MLGREESFKILRRVSLARGLKKAAKPPQCFCCRVELSAGSGHFWLEGPAAASYVKVGRRRLRPGLSSQAERAPEEGGPPVPAAITSEEACEAGGKSGCPCKPFPRKPRVPSPASPAAGGSAPQPLQQIPGREQSGWNYSTGTERGFT